MNEDADVSGCWWVDVDGALSPLVSLSLLWGSLLIPQQFVFQHFGGSCQYDQDHVFGGVLH